MLLKNSESNFLEVRILSGTLDSTNCHDNYVSYKVEALNLKTKSDENSLVKRNICVEHFLKIGAKYFVVTLELEALITGKEVEKFILFSEIVNNNYILLDKHFVVFEEQKTEAILLTECVDGNCTNSDRFRGVALSKIIGGFGQ